MLYEEYCKKWLQLKKGKIADSTWSSYADLCERVILPTFGQMHLEEITSLDVELFLGWLLASGRASGTVKRVYSVFRSSLSKAVKLGLLRANPAGSDFIDPLPRRKPETAFFSAAEVQRILIGLEEEPLQWRAYGRLALDSGARRGEILGLQWQDLDGCICHIRRAGYQLSGAAPATKVPKSGQTRIVRLTEETRNILLDLRRLQKRECLRSGSGWRNSHFVFGASRMLHPSTPTHWWIRFRKRMQLPPLPLHALRHTSATLLLSNGVDLKTVSCRLGHSSIEVTDLYLHLVDDADRHAAEVMERILTF